MRSATLREENSEGAREALTASVIHSTKIGGSHQPPQLYNRDSASQSRYNLIHQFFCTQSTSLTYLLGCCGANMPDTILLRDRNCYFPSHWSTVHHHNNNHRCCRTSTTLLRSSLNMTQNGSKG